MPKLNTAQMLYLKLGLLQPFAPDGRRSPSCTKAGPGRRHLQGPLDKDGRKLAA